ncbi:MAG TPA: MarR family transcriptional regulator [Sandaracinaceae bacterium LLY-WYZ-13_1]|nr:MarR family transcriptional regulator [Sandaracinaceae bacterium LLY-WYZ-13_1]
MSIPDEPAKPAFTELQGQYLAFIYAYSKIHRRPPAETDMQRFFQVTPPTVHRMVKALHRKGLIHRVPGTPRSIELLVAPDDLPVLR